MSTITPATRRALAVIAERPGIRSGRELAKALWPDSPGWRKRSHRHATPAGGALATGIVMRAGSFATKLEDAGLIHIEYGSFGSRKLTLTTAGRKALDS